MMKRSSSEKIEIPAFKDKTKNPISDIFRSLYKIHIRLIQNNKTLSYNCWTVPNRKLNYFFLYAISICSSTIDPIQSLVLGVELLYKHSFSLFSIMWILVKYLLNNCYLHITNTVAPLVEVFSCCFCLVIWSNIALVFCKSLFQHPLSLPDILLGAKWFWPHSN